ncbi:hypothetical protein DFH08DRAFT_41770 [Mycena albidolilacea]|uniref:Uncharacterized protein n=1 Tax=Mycena albidolilacea TaxID=1033008 RepID=A0AAD7ABA3_9AGAR|nr:hypothetical protein DFH08DRAFT_41770 [Mycena albidolilacea]
MLSSVLVIVPFIAGNFVANDWTTLCVTGQCSYDLPATDGPSGTMKIILECDPKALSQNIRLSCVHQRRPHQLTVRAPVPNGGAVNKIVRLPEAAMVKCDANAFARVSKPWVPDDQSIPASLQARVVRRDGSQSTVKAVAIDTDFDAVETRARSKSRSRVALPRVHLPPLQFPDPAVYPWCTHHHSSPRIWLELATSQNRRCKARRPRNFIKGLI